MEDETRQTRDDIDRPVQFLKGIGPARAEALAGRGIATVRDLLLHVPRRYLDRSTFVTVERLRREAFNGSQDGPPTRRRVRGTVSRSYTVLVEVRSFRVSGFRAKSRLIVVMADTTGSIQCVWFGGVQYWKNRFRVGEVLAVSGTPSVYGNVLQFVHPEIDRVAGPDENGGTNPEEIEFTRLINTGGLVPLYPSSGDLERVGLDSSGFRRVIRNVLLEHDLSLPDVLPHSLREKRGLIPFHDAIRQVHAPGSQSELDLALRRLKYEEFFFFQLMLARARARLKERTKGISFSIRSKLARQLVDGLSFKLTAAQKRVINEITSDMQSEKPLHRLLQGDVGSGKTVVALIAILIAVENGYQAAFMAPTEILAEQHFRTLASFLTGIEVNVRLLVGKQKSRLRKDILDDISRGSAQIVVGTHALFEESVEFAKLGLVVIDEQHRFGVVQRASIRQKGNHPDVLVMTATPIPRTLSLTLYGELDVSVIDEMPRDRKPVDTLLKYDDEKEWVYELTRKQVKLGGQAYYVYPIIEESEKVDLKAATSHYQHLRTDVFPGLRLGLIHGRLSGEEKEDVMGRFVRGEIDILVGTTVIEVGIDVPNATLMVIENAGRFGLSQLHQLRGRVGRGSEKSTCILLAETRRAVGMIPFDGSYGEAEESAIAAEKRLRTMVETSDGFKIAEVDLQLRGPGDFFGTRQSGVPLFRVASLLTDLGILEEARADAFAIIARDPDLSLPEHRSLVWHLDRYHREASSLMQTA
jgi:ATP-dependent DNA helicase RecG